MAKSTCADPARTQERNCRYFNPSSGPLYHPCYHHTPPRTAPLHRKITSRKTRASSASDELPLSRSVASSQGAL
ncbi:hypothetical protein RRG08_022769 [Elysia crispata]|uniref:Uncharacterized protein n=1 Tax=Elysia crispata TaxID=231223 RepID=A0AAE0ZWR1_9GAST|nr:hypothetical protein RRG08_022769 [Elysia crispata]